MLDFLAFVLLCAVSAYLWSDNRKLLEQRVADAMRMSRDKEEEAKSKGAKVLMGKQMLNLNQENEELRRRVEEAEGELKRKAVEVEGLMKTEADLKAFYRSTRDKEIALVRAGLEQEKKGFKREIEEQAVTIDGLREENGQLRDRVSEWYRRFNNTNHTDEVIKFPQFLIGSPLPSQSPRKHGAVYWSQQNDSGMNPSEAKNWNHATSVPHGVRL